MKCIFSMVSFLVMVSSAVQGISPSISIVTTATVLAQSKIHEERIAQIEAGDPKSGRENGKIDIPVLMKKLRIPGVSIAVIHDFEIVWTREYGFARKDAEIKVSPTTTFQAGSISKPASAMAALHAVEQGKFGLDDPINSLLTSWKLGENRHTDKRAVTPRMLLSHTGGTTVHGFGGYKPSGKIPTLPQLLSGSSPANSGKVSVNIEPFTKYRYSGGGTMIMQMAMEDVHGEKFEDILARTVLTPLGMTSSTFVQPKTAGDAPNAAFAHGGKGKNPWHTYPEQAAAGLWSTPTDLAKFAIGVQKMLRGDEGGILSKDMARAMMTPTAVGGTYGLGFERTTTKAGSYFNHAGYDWGFVGLLFAHESDGYGVAIMTNGKNGGDITNEILVRIAEAYSWDRS